MKSFAIALLGATSVTAITSQIRYIEHLGQFGINFADFNEFQERLDIFMKNDKFISAHNNKSGEIYRLRHNQFSDWK